MTDFLGNAFPRLAERLQKVALADLPTPVSTIEFDTDASARQIAVKHDDQTNSKYGGNKIRKLEYIFHRARERGAHRIATFGAVSEALRAVPLERGKPSAIIAKTVGGHGVSFMADQTLWHYRVPSADELARALAELGEQPLQAAAR